MKIRPKSVSFLVAFCLMLGSASFVAAQEQEENQQRRQRQGRNGVAQQIMNSLKDCELSEEQTAKIKEIIESHKEKLAETQKAVRDALPDDLRRQRSAAQRKAREEGLSRADARKAVEEAVALTDEQKEKLDQAQQAQRQLRNKINRAIVALLTPEQVEKAKLTTGQGNNRNRNRNRNRDGGGDGGDGDGQVAR